MYKIHTTREGDRVMICNMEDSHLLNTIKLHFRRINEAKARLAEAVKLMQGNGELNIDPILSAVTGVNAKQVRRQAQEMHDNAQRRIQALNEKVQPYIMEATLRNLTSLFIERMQETYGRKTKLDVGDVRIGLLSGDVSAVDDEDDKDDDDAPVGSDRYWMDYEYH